MPRQPRRRKGANLAPPGCPRAVRLHRSSFLETRSWRSREQRPSRMAPKPLTLKGASYDPVRYQVAGCVWIARALPVAAGDRPWRLPTQLLPLRRKLRRVGGGVDAVDDGVSAG